MTFLLIDVVYGDDRDNNGRCTGSIISKRYLRFELMNNDIVKIRQTLIDIAHLLPF